MTLRDFLQKLRSQSASNVTSVSKGKSEVEMVNITGSSFLLDNIETEFGYSEDHSNSSNPSRLASALEIHGGRNRYMKISPEDGKQSSNINAKNIDSSKKELSANAVPSVITTTEGEMPRYDPLETVPLRGQNTSEWTQQEDPKGFIAANNKKHNRSLAFILTASLLSVAFMITLGVTAIVLRNTYSTPTIPVGNQTLPSDVHNFSEADHQWIIPDMNAKRSILRMSENSAKYSHVNFSEYKEDLSNTQKQDSHNVQPTPIIIPIPIFFKSANETEIEKSLVVGNDALHKRQMVESELLKNGKIPRQHSTTAYHQYFGKTYPMAKQLSLLGFKMEKSYKSLSSRMKLSKNEVLNGALRMTENNTLPKEWCKPQEMKICNDTDVYRTFDGSCNNLVHTSWGSSNMPYRRILQPDYTDGISEPRSLSVDGSLLPNPLEISSNVHLDKYRDDSEASMLLPLWGQFVAHDLILTATSSGQNGTQISCCADGLPLSPQHPECIPLVYNSSITSKQQCMSVIRSAPFPGCELGPREQFNQVSAYLDASNIYGSPESQFEQQNLREQKHGRLKEYKSSDNRAMLPVLDDLNDMCNKEGANETDPLCFKAGDPRVNIETSITSMYTIWMRHHNEITDNLVLLNPHWDDEKLFQEARRILTAQIQHITYNEFLPVVLGQDIMEKSGLKLLPDGYYQKYDTSANPAISNVFAAAAFKFGDSMIKGLIQMIDPLWKNIDFIQLQKLRANPFLLWSQGKMDALTRGMASTPAAKVDAYFTSQLSKYTFSGLNESDYIDLVAINIQQGRDHGLPSYTSWRQICGHSSVVEEFSELENEWDEAAAALISNIYKSVKDVDVYTGLLAEKPVTGAIVGPTFACLLADQFLRLKMGDRFWYEGDIQRKPFTLDQLKTIRQTTFARILCDNGDYLKEIQIKPMLQKSASNPMVNCADLDIPKLNYGPWREFLFKEAGHIENTTKKSLDDLDHEVWGKDDLENSAENKRIHNGTTLLEKKPSPDRNKSILLTWSSKNSSSTDGANNGVTTAEPNIDLESFHLVPKGEGKMMIVWDKPDKNSTTPTTQKSI